MANSQVCRLCLEVISDDFQTLDHHLTEMLEKISLKVDLALTAESVVCFKCRDVLQQTYDFKITCLDNEKLYSETYNINCDSRVKQEEESICRFCLRYLDDDSYVKFVVDEDSYLANMLQKCLAEIKPSITHQQLICNNCIKNFQNMYSFVINCINNEKKVKEYVQVKGTTRNSQVNLRDAIKFIGDVNNKKTCETDLNIIKCETAKELVKSDSRGIVDKKEEIFGKIQDDDISRGILDSISCDITVKKEEFERIEEDEIDIKDDQDILQEAQMEIDSNNSQKNTKLTNKKLNPTMHKCTCCSYESKYKRNLRMHLLRRHPDSSEGAILTCPQCSYETKVKDNLLKHMKIHKDKSKITMYRCEVCSFESKYKASLQGHMLLHISMDHPDVPKHKCTKCSFESRYKSSLQNHLFSHMDKSEIPIHKCVECSFESRHKQSIRKHEIVHISKGSSEVVMHKCTQCSFES